MGGVQMEIVGDVDLEKCYTRPCDCRKKTQTMVTMRPSMDRRFYFGKCGRCGKEYQERK